MRLSYVTLGVDNVRRATAFYVNVLGLELLPSSSDAVSFFDVGGLRLALYGRADLAAAGGVCDNGVATSSIALSHNVDSPDQVGALLHHIQQQSGVFGGRVTRAAHRTSWGSYAGWFTDPDGFLWEVTCPAEST